MENALMMNGANVQSLEELKKNFNKADLLHNRKRFGWWLKFVAEEEGMFECVQTLENNLSDDVWLEKVVEIIGCQKELEQFKKKEEEERKRQAAEKRERERQETERRRQQHLEAEIRERKRQAAEKRERELYPSFPIVVNSTNCYCLNDLRVNFNANADALALIRYRPQLYAWLRGAGEKELAKQVKNLSPELADGAWLLSVSKILGIIISPENLRQAAFFQRLCVEGKKENEAKKDENGSVLKTALGVTAGVAGVGALIALTGGAGLAAAVGAGASALGLGKLLGKDKK
mgnify:FL=1